MNECIVKHIDPLTSNDTMTLGYLVVLIPSLIS